jgi:hypothetical protein
MGLTPADNTYMTMKHVTIMSIWTKRNAADEPFTYSLPIILPLAELDEEQAALGAAFAATNNDDRPHGRQCCSTSAGDIMIVDGKYFLVEGHGFEPITFEQSVQIRHLTSRETSFGLQDMLDNGLVRPAGSGYGEGPGFKL